jgi:hypothetical protein
MGHNAVAATRSGEPQRTVSPSSAQVGLGGEVDIPRNDLHDSASEDEDNILPQSRETGNEKSKAPVAWKDLPQRPQLIIITLARLSEPLVQTSLQVSSAHKLRLDGHEVLTIRQSYLFYQLKWFDPSLPDSTIASQAGVLHASFMAAQFVTAMLWGRVADSKRLGRKKVLLIGLIGTGLSCLGFGFSTKFWQALVFRLLGGMTNGNVGVMRTM